LRKAGLIALILLLAVFITGCDAVFQEDTSPTNPEILRIRGDELGGEIIYPGSGNFVYERGTTAELELQANEGYEFAGWRGENADEVMKVDDYNWQIYMDDNKELYSEFTLIEFLLWDSEPKSDAEKVSYDISEVILTYNNTVDREKLADDISVYQVDEPETEEEEVESNIIQDIVVDNNKIILELEGNLNFGAEYAVTVSENIWDIEGNFAEPEDFVFTVEKGEPGIPVINNIRQSNEEDIEIIWESSLENIKDESERNAGQYRIYRSLSEDDDFEELVELKAHEDDDEEDNDFSREDNLISYTDGDIDSDNIYYYKITAVDEAGTESEPSDILSSDN